jgi:hypothetical protein
MPQREDTFPGWPAPAGFTPVGCAPPAPAAPAPPLSPGDPVAADVHRERLTLWRHTRRRMPPPRPRGVVLGPAIEPRGVLGIADFHELRREGLFTDDGRNPPPSWWAR